MTEKTPKEVKIFNLDQFGNHYVCIVYTDGSYDIKGKFGARENGNNIMARVREVVQEYNVQHRG